MERGVYYAACRLSLRCGISWEFWVIIPQPHPHGDHPNLFLFVASPNWDDTNLGVIC